MARKAAADKAQGKTTSVVSATVPNAVREALEDIRWGERLTMSEIVLTAITDFLVARGVVVEDDTDKPE